MKSIDEMTMRELKKCYPWGSYCDIKKKGVISPMPKGYEDLARKRYKSSPEKVINIRLRTGKDDY